MKLRVALLLAAVFAPSAAIAQTEVGMQDDLHGDAEEIIVTAPFARNRLDLLDAPADLLERDKNRAFSRDGALIRSSQQDGHRAHEQSAEGEQCYRDDPRDSHNDPPWSTRSTPNNVR